MYYCTPADISPSLLLLLQLLLLLLLLQLPLHNKATMIVADAATCLEVSGRGDLLEPADGVHAIGSGARFAIAAARALLQHAPALAPMEIAARAMRIAAERCVYTNNHFVWEHIAADGSASSSSGSSSSNGSTSSSNGSSSSKSELGDGGGC
jgi:hypothetical protein